MTDKQPRDRSITTNQEKLLTTYKRISQARHAETMRVADLIEMAVYAAESKETLDALVDLAAKVLEP